MLEQKPTFSNCYANTKRFLEMGEARNREGPISSQAQDLPKSAPEAAIPTWCSLHQKSQHRLCAVTFRFELCSLEELLPNMLLPQQGKYKPPRELLQLFPESVTVCACRGQ